MNRRKAIYRLLFVSVLLTTSGASLAKEVYFTHRGLAIRGYDPVAYFTDGRAVGGESAYALEWQGVEWRFASAEHLAMFQKSPERFAPQYGGYCAYAVSQGYLASVDPTAWTVHENKLYLNYSHGVKRIWEKDMRAYIRQGDVNWPGLMPR
ncbi:MAG: YHS domain protein [Gammaproteobacteria bacterium]|nr:YHS domain protein [Gammaproteobacteria bacterium]NIR83152.1 YHS domain protein [Gammaproteobacteria bacterium]NIR90960.1 YHS domain protein [Gammaproteobacteria bacterium]NIU04317.1 YHS domain protein [Gammaproteobacteria bacterium]NIV52540.1 YHS domain protein [Gammaproteobacteria bacterium]